MLANQSRIIGVFAAINTHGLYGVKGKLPWEYFDGKRLGADMKHFKETTQGHVLIMGRRTWESFLGKTLPNRIHIVITQSPQENPPQNVYFVPSVYEAIELTGKIAPEKNVFFVGGEHIWRAGLQLANRVFLTEVKKSYPMNLDMGIFFDLTKMKERYPLFDEVSRVEILDCASGIFYDMITYKKK